MQEGGEASYSNCLGGHLKGISSIGGAVRGALAGVLLLVLVPVAAAEQVRSLKPVKPPSGNEQRLALVIGNSAYKSSPLRNPVNDARAMATALSETGFQVTLIEDAGRATMRRVIRDWGDQLARGGVGLFYYAGHGMQIRGRNYLIPVTADVQREDEVEDESVDVNTVLAKMESAKNMLNLVILDACRNNPFQRSFRSVAQGLAQMDAPTGTLISFATAPGSVAADGTGDNGLYTSHLLRAIRTPGLPIEQLFKQVRIGVTKDTGDKQVPWESSSLRGDFYFLPPVPGAAGASRADVDKAVQEATKAAEARAAQERTALQGAMEKMIADALAKQRAQLEAERKQAAAPTPTPAPVPTPAPAAPRVDERQIELAFWDSIKSSTNAADFSAYLERYPQGAFAPIARNRVQQSTASVEVKTAVAQKPAPAVAPVPTQVASIAPATPVVAPAEGRWQYAGGDVSYSSRKFEHLVELHGSSAAGALETIRVRGGGETKWVYTAAPSLVGHANGWAMFSPLTIGETFDVGKTWSNISVERVEVCGAGLVTCTASAKVVSREKIAVKTGTFDTFKVVVEMLLRASGAVATRELTYWHAPEVGRPVRYSMRTLGGCSGGASCQMRLTDPDVDFELVAFRNSGGRSSGTIDASLAGAGASGSAAPILVASASPTRGAIQMQGPAVPKVGDRWEYELRDLSNSRTTRQRIDIGAVGADGILENVATDGGGSFTLQHGPGAYLSGAAFVQFSPYLLAFGGLDNAAVAGEVATVRLPDCDGVRNCSVSARVVGTEKVATPAGAFDAVRVDVAVSIVRTGSHAIGAFGRLDLSFWYARDVRRVVRATGRGTGPQALMSDFELTLQSLKVQ